MKLIIVTDEGDFITDHKQALNKSGDYLINIGQKRKNV